MNVKWWSVDLSLVEYEYKHKFSHSELLPGVPVNELVKIYFDIE